MTIAQAQAALDEARRLVTRRARPPEPRASASGSLPAASPKGILFSAPMVNALLAGRKTQTRRIVQITKPIREWLVGQGIEPEYYVNCSKGGERFANWNPDRIPPIPIELAPYAVGDTLLVGEAWRTLFEYDHLKPSELPADAAIRYEAGAPTWTEQQSDAIWGRYRHARFLPFRFRRLRRTVAAIRSERLKSITEADAQAEGLIHTPREPPFPCWQFAPGGDHYPTAIDAFAALWDSLHGDDAPWHGPVPQNPRLWVYEFQVRP